jgi:crotonobetainyl-CoA:carnitine CoA-transferase CaiB-like acyl-CoA transferase
MQLGETRNEDAQEFGKPLDGIRILALEQMQAVPFATQMLARLGAEVVKVEGLDGESGRTAQPAAPDASGRPAGATFLRYNLSKESIAIDMKSDRGRELVLDLAGKFDVLVENLGPGRADRFGVGYGSVSSRHPHVIYASVTGFGASGDSPYAKWPAYAGVAEAMSGAYEFSRLPNQPPIINPMGGLGDTGTGMFAVIGILAALLHRACTGLGQLVDVSMLDSMLSIIDLPTNYWSLGTVSEPDVELRVPYILRAFRAKTGWCMVQVSREHQFERLARMLGQEEWLTDERFANRFGWYDHWDDVIRPALEGWAEDLSILEAASALADAGIAAAPCFHPEDIVQDAHVEARGMLVQIPRFDSVEQPVLVAGNPVKLSRMTEGPERRPPVVGEHTSDVLRDLLDLDEEALAELHEDGIVVTTPPSLDQ